MNDTTINNFSNSKNIQLLENLSINVDNFCVFKSINNIYCLIYGFKKSIICLNLDNNKKMSEIKNASDYLINFRHYLDKMNNRDLILIFCENDFKIWNINNLECLLSIENIYNSGNISASFLKDHNNICVVTCVGQNYSDKPIKIFNLNGKIIKKINTKIDAFYIDSFYDKKTSKNYIITGNEMYITSYDYNKSKIYHKYSEFFDKANNCFSRCNYIIIKIETKITKLISSFSDGIIRIWNFHLANLMKKIEVKDFYLNNTLYSTCLLNDTYLFAGLDKKMKLININEGKIIKEFDAPHVFIIQKIFHPKYKECLISYDNFNLRLWKYIN